MEDEVFSNFMAFEQSRINYWRMHIELDAICSGAKPNPSHHFAAFLASFGAKESKEGNGKLLGVLTQNVDGLYQQAGLQDSLVVELHGTSKRVRCMKCKELYGMNETLERIKRESQERKEERRKALESQGQSVDEAELDEIFAVPYCTVEGKMAFLSIHLSSLNMRS